jgi:hypothetical protein
MAAAHCTVRSENWVYPPLCQRTWFLILEPGTEALFLPRETDRGFDSKRYSELNPRDYISDLVPRGYLGCIILITSPHFSITRPTGCSSRSREGYATCDAQLSLGWYPNQRLRSAIWAIERKDAWGRSHRTVGTLSGDAFALGSLHMLLYQIRDSRVPMGLHLTSHDLWVELSRAGSVRPIEVKPAVI